MKAVAGCGLMLSALTASAQYQPRQDPVRYQMQDQREAREHNRLFDRIQGDLDRAHSATLPFSSDRARVMRARQEVTECQNTVANGTYSRRSFDEAINAVQRVADANRLSEQSRDYLLSDVRQLRDLQQRLEG